MTTMLERMAEAQFAIVHKEDHRRGLGQLPPWSDLLEEDRAFVIRQVRAGIEAVRESAQAILAAHHVVPDDNDFAERAADNWRNLLDAILKEQP